MMKFQWRLLTRVGFKLVLSGLAGIAGLASATPGVPGTIDETWAPLSVFGAGKLVMTVAAGRFNAANAVAIQADGKIVLAGECGNEFCAARLQVDGSPDTSFNGTGAVTTQIGVSVGTATAVAIQVDGKIVLGGWCVSAGTAPNFCAMRYNADGSLDSTFNGTGKVINVVDNSLDQRLTAVVIQPDGKIVLGGWCGNSFCAVRYLSNGSLDTAFNGSGKVVTSGIGRANAMALQADGKIVMAGICGGVFCAARYNTNGSLDSSFNGTGTVSTPGTFEATTVAIQADGKIVLTGNCPSFCAVRYRTDGSLDFGLNQSGVAFVSFFVNGGYGRAAAVQPDGRIVLAGTCLTSGNDRDFCILRYDSDGRVDYQFGYYVGLGIVTTPVAGVQDEVKAMVIQPDGKIVIAGSCTVGSNALTNFCAVRYDGGPFAAQNCKLDIDGDNRVLLTTDSLIHLRIALGMTGNAVIAGINFPAAATRKTWPAIRSYLVTQCSMSLPL
jgi:uncharacterized delta-60 repeat protein